MKYLVIGNGARESAILWKLRQDEPEAELFCLPGNGGTSTWATNVNIPMSELEAIADFVAENQIDLTIVGPEQPLVDGVVDYVRGRGLTIIGPDKNTAALEGSKAFAKEFMKKYHIPTAAYETYKDLDSAFRSLDDWKYPFVIKADGLAAGKGVLIVKNRQEAEDGLKQIMSDKKFGNAGNKVVFEEFLQGTEASLICFVDGNTILPMESARDYKRAYDNDEGLNTGGMGCFSPNLILNQDSIQKEIRETILNPMLAGIRAEKMDYRGMLFIGLMLTAEGVKVLEFNVRFGDPETEVLLPRLKNKLSDVFRAMDTKTLSDITLEWKKEACVCVVLAAKGYPENVEKGKQITVPSSLAKEMIFYGGVSEQDGKLYSNGGRVLVVASYGEDMASAAAGAYQLAEQITFEGRWYRTDIAKSI